MRTVLAVLPRDPDLDSAIGLLKAAGLKVQGRILQGRIGAGAGASDVGRAKLVKAAGWILVAQGELEELQAA